jgi:DHA1 family inner membrane transport protein
MISAFCNCHPFGTHALFKDHSIVKKRLRVNLDEVFIYDSFTSQTSENWRVKLMQKPLWMIYTTHMFIEIYLLIQVAIIPVIVSEFELSLLEASLIATVPSLTALLMNIPSGFLADRFSTNHLLFASMLIEGLSALAISQTNSFWALVVGASFMRIASPIYHIPGLSQISRLVKPEQMSKSVGFHNALGSFGTAVGLVSLTVFLSTLGWRWTYLFWALPILAWGFVLLSSSQLKIKQVGSRQNSGKSRSARLFFVFSPALLMFLAVIGIREIGATGSSTFMTTYFVDVRNLSETTASLVFGLGPFVGIVGSLGGGYLGQRLGARKALSWIILSCSISLLTLSFMSQLYFLTVVFLVYALFSNALWSPMNTIVASITSTADRGLSYSVYFFTEGLIASFAPSLAAGVIELSSVWHIFPFSVAFFIASLIILQFLIRLERQKDDMHKGHPNVSLTDAQQPDS